MAWGGESADGESGPSVRLAEGGLSVRATKTPVERILSEIAGAYGASTVMEGTFAAPISVSFTDLTLAEAIRRLVGKAPFLILYAPDPDGVGRSRPSAIRIYAAPDSSGYKDQVKAAPDKANGDRAESATGLGKPRVAESPDHPDLTASEVEALAARAVPQDLDALGRVVEDHPDLQVRYLALTLLGDIPDQRVVLAIERGLGEEDPLFRSYVVEVLSRVDVADAVRSLGQVLYGEPDPLVRLLAVNGLAGRDEEPARAFLQVAVEDPDRRVRAAAARALQAGH